MNNNFHIRSLIGEEATCWHISENMVSVNWDSGVTEHFWKKDLDKMVKCNGWEYIVKDSYSPTKDFKFTCDADNHEIEYRFQVFNDGSTSTSWIGRGGKKECLDDILTLEQVDGYLKEGKYSFVPEQEPFKVSSALPKEDTQGYSEQSYEKGNMNSLTNKFKVSYKDSEEVMSIVTPINGEHIVATDEDGDVYTWWTVADMEKFIADGVWKVIPEEKKEDFTRQCIAKLNMYTGCMSYNDSYFGEPSGELKRVIRQLDKTYKIPENKLDISTLQLKIEIDGVKEAYEMLDEMVAKSNTVLEKIKSFTSGTGHDVWIESGVYKVFRQYEDIPYIARDEDTLMEIMDAIVVLDSVETE